MPLPIAGIAPLSKGILSVTGKDATKFLNGLITSRLLPNVVKKKQHTISDKEDKHANLAEIIDIHENWGLMHEDIYDPENEILIGRDGINSMFLNSKGRVTSDCFLYSNPFHNFNNSFDEVIKKPSFLVEVDTKSVSTLESLLKLHKLSAKVKISRQESIYSYYYYSDTLEFDQFLEEVQGKYFMSLDPVGALQNANSFIKDEILFNSKIASSIVGFAIDNRIPNFGFKLLTNKPLSQDSDSEETISTNSLFSESFRSSFPTAMTSEEVINKRRYVNGVFEIQDVSKDTSLLPFESNLDYINGLSLEKGCYVGQELTIRTFNNGVIRKRVMPAQLFNVSDEAIEGISAQGHISIDSADPVIADLKLANQSCLRKLDLSPLVESAEETEDSLSNASNAVQNPFGSSPFAESKPVRRRKTSSGKILSIQDNLAFVLMNLAETEKTDLFKIQIPSLEGGEKVVGVKIFTPDWWPQEE
ncbi:putative transferase CAF17, mitochondrial [Scheffersomyces xylosifermentans]|uniref:putative transferase CAF17, mitochondrial n=1 Tax=Scheffersomyces xylosifermentans TaxID=1304137 RepID=UPI00315D3675